MQPGNKGTLQDRRGFCSERGGGWDLRRAGKERMTNRQAFQIADSFSDFIDNATKNRDLWHAMAARAREYKELVEELKSIPGSWRLLAIADDLCGDAVNIIPTVAVLAEAVPNLELRIVSREVVPKLMDRHLTRGARAIPVIILLDEEGRERGWWGPRPQPLQDWVNRVGRGMETADRYRELRRWYARDRGATTAEAIVDLVRCGSGTEGWFQGDRSSDSSRSSTVTGWSKSWNIIPLGCSSL